MTDKFAEDWAALWQSELTAMATDRELKESLSAMLALWARSATASLSLLQLAHDRPRREPTALQPPRPPAASAAPEPGLDEVASLSRRVAELEQRLATLEPAGQPKPGPGDAGKPLRRRHRA